MTDTVRCPACRGAKKVPKLGGIVGECNTCNGKGSINAVDKPVKVEITVEDVCARELVNAVADCIPASTVTITKPVELPNSERVVVDSIKVDGKKGIYRRKATAK